VRKRRPHLRVTMPELNRMSELREAGLTYNAIASVLSIDTGKPFTGEHVRSRLNYYLPNSRKSPRGRPFNGKAAA